MSKTMRLIALATVFAVVLVACGDSSGGSTTTPGAQLELITAGTLTVCTEPPYFPMEFEDPDAPTGYNGFDIQLSEAIAEEMDLDIVVKEILFDLIVNGLAFESNDCDMGAASITIREDRARDVQFSTPYFNAEQSLLVKKDSGISSWEDLAGKRVGVQTNTTGHFFVRDNVEDAEVVELTAEGLHLALIAGNVEGVVTDLVANQGYIDENDDETLAVVDTFDTEEEYGLATKDSPNLLAAINAALAKFRSDGTYNRIYDTWFPRG